MVYVIFWWTLIFIYVLIDCSNLFRVYEIDYFGGLFFLQKSKLIKMRDLKYLTLLKL